MSNRYCSSNFAVRLACFIDALLITTKLGLFTSVQISSPAMQSEAKYKMNIGINTLLLNSVVIIPSLAFLSVCGAWTMPANRELACEPVFKMSSLRVYVFKCDKATILLRDELMRPEKVTVYMI
jgi:hypothetical protein